MEFEEYAFKLNASDFEAEQRPKQNQKDAILPAHPQEQYPLGREFGLILNHKTIRFPIIQCRRN